MELCSDGHDEVCFEGRDCPVCAAQEQIEDIQDTMYDLQNENDSLREEVNMLSKEINELKLENGNG